MADDKLTLEEALNLAKKISNWEYTKVFSSGRKREEYLGAINGVTIRLTEHDIYTLKNVFYTISVKTINNLELLKMEDIITSISEGELYEEKVKELYHNLKDEKIEEERERREYLEKVNAAENIRKILVL